MADFFDRAAAKERSDRAKAREAAKRERAAARKASPSGYVRFIAAVVDRETGVIRWSTVRGSDSAAIRALVDFLLRDGAIRADDSPAAAGKPPLTAREFRDTLSFLRDPKRWVLMAPANDGKEIAQVVKGDKLSI